MENPTIFLFAGCMSGLLDVQVENDLHLFQHSELEVNLHVAYTLHSVLIILWFDIYTL